MRVLVLVAIVLALVAVMPTGSEGASLFRSRSFKGGVLAEGACVDVKPKGSEQYSCAQQKSWGKCGESWMAGYCKKTCGKCGGGSGKSSGGHSSSSSLAALGIIGSSDQTAQIHNYGASYKSHKDATHAALVKSGMSHAHVVLCMAIGMVETNTFSPDSRDKKKTGDSTNYSAFNINRDMLRNIGVTADESLNTFAGLPKVAAALKKAIAQFGVNGFLNFHRGGSTGYKDGVSYGCADYRRGIASMVRMIDASPALLTDGRRIDMKIKHV